MFYWLEMDKEPLELETAIFTSVLCIANIYEVHI